MRSRRGPEGAMREWIGAAARWSCLAVAAVARTHEGLERGKCATLARGVPG